MRPGWLLMTRRVVSVVHVNRGGSGDQDISSLDKNARKVIRPKALRSACRLEHS